ncbi:MAG: YfcE family phosphodiesterase [Bacilli bacterium]|nr:YfcE family phosphodiesterase [Bacilli bacterium]
MKYVVFSDIHGSTQGVNRLVSICKEEKPDCLILLGDILHGGYDEDDYYVARELKLLTCGILGVRGNCDYSMDERTLGIPLPLTRNIPFGNGLHTVYLMHRPPIISFPPGDIVMFGHTHRKMLEKEDGVIYFNPGSISLPRDDGPGYGIMEDNRLILMDALKREIIRELEF